MEMEEFYFDKEFEEQSDFNFDQYQYLFGLQPKPDGQQDDPHQPVGIIVKRRRSSRHKSGGSDASDSINQLLHVTFKQTDDDSAQNDAAAAADDDDDDSAFFPDESSTAAAAHSQQRPPSRRHPHRDRWSANTAQPTGIPAPVSRQSRQTKSRDPSPLDRGRFGHRYSNGNADNGLDQLRHSSQTRQMNRSTTSGQTRRPQHSRSAAAASAAAGAGSIDEEGFLAAFEQVQKINVYSNRDVIDCLNRIRDTLSGSASEDWEKRVDAMKQLRSLLLAGGPEFEDFLSTLRSLAVPFRCCITDLRSQVVREACITIAHLASCLGNRFDQFAEPVMEPLLALLGNSAKIVATCGMVCVSLLLRHTQSHRLLPSLLALGQAKSAIQRRSAAELLANQVLPGWPAHALERQLPGLLDWLRRCLADADQEARSNGRRAFWQFGRQFWPQAASVLNTCDSRTRAAIERVRPSDMPAPAAPGASAAARAPQSTPASRGASPPRAGRSGMGGPRSQASSRGSSPPRSGIPLPTNSSTPAPAGSSFVRRSSQGTGGGGSVSARSSFRGGGGRQQRVEQQAAAQSALAEALQFKLQQRRQAGDGEDASETSSVCSDASFKSFTNLAEILGQLQSSEWSCRRDGLASFSSYLAREGGPALNQLELRRVCEIFAKMFGEPNGRVMQFFLDALGDFVGRYHGELHDWLYTLLVRLIGRMATETLVSQQARFQTALERIQRAFPIALQLRCLLRFLIDQNQQPSPRVQSALLQCLLQVVRQLPADALSPWRNQSDQPGPGHEARIALSRLTTLTKDPKSPDVRRLSQAVLAALFDLNPGCFSAVLKEMQPTIQQRATDVLRLQLGARGAADVSNLPASTETPQRQSATPSAQPPSSAAAATAAASARGGAGRTARAAAAPAAPRDTADASGAEDLRSSIHRAALNLQSFNRRPADDSSAEAPAATTLPVPTPVRPAQLANGRLPVSASTQQQHPQPPHPTTGGLRNQQPTAAEVTSTPSRFQPVQQPQQQQPLSHVPPPALQSTLGQPDFEDFDDELLDDDEDDDIDEISSDDAVTGILKELSNHNQRHEQRMSSMQRLVRMVRDNSVDSWDEHFKTVLLILLETLGDNESEIRTLALTVLQELIRAQPRRLANYTELTLLKILEAHRDADKTVAKAAEDCAKHVAAHLPGDVCLRVLTPLVSGSDNGLALAAVKMQMRVIQECEPRHVEAALPDLCPGLVRCCDHSESQIRKAAIFCLVQMYMKVGETLLLHLKDMSSTKRRLLQLYICKARVGTAQDGGGVALPPVS